jgi:alpha-beta hydrolase superfamily lysophospholipase
LLCPPLGWDDVASYRVRFTWAEALAARGHTTLRFDLPGTGDSPGSPDDPRRLEAWTDAIVEASRWLRSANGQAVAAIGIGGGGLILWNAVAKGAPMDALVLWGVPARGASYARELRAFGRLEALELATEVSPTAQVGPGGFPFSTETLAELEGLDLAHLPFPKSPSRRVLLLERDGLPVDDRLVKLLGTDVTVSRGDGYGEMLAEPGIARPPDAVFDLVADWLELPGEETPAQGTEARAEAASVPVGRGVRESPLEVEHDAQQLAGILTEPAEADQAGICAVFLNSGAIRRIGPGRMYVSLARRWAERGVPSLRLDLAGIGDSEGDAARLADVAEFYEPPFAGQISAALDTLTARLASRSFLLLGLCSGGYWAFEVALSDERVAAVAAVNPGALIWSPLLLDDRMLQPLAQSLRRARSPKELLRITRVIAARLRARLARRLGGDRLDRALDRLRARRTSVLLLFAEAEPQLWELERDGQLARRGRWPTLKVEHIAGRDHTLRPPPMQAQAHSALDRFVDELLGG